MIFDRQKTYEEELQERMFKKVGIELPRERENLKERQRDRGHTDGWLDG